jgi:hypothetical protein
MNQHRLDTLSLVCLLAVNASVASVVTRPSTRLCTDAIWCNQGRPLGGASGALAPGADFEGAPKRRSPTGHTLIRMVISSFANEKSRKGFFFKFGCIGFSLFYVFLCLHMYIHVILYVYCCKYCWLPPWTSRPAMYPPLVQ